MSRDRDKRTALSSPDLGGSHDENSILRRLLQHTLALDSARRAHGHGAGIVRAALDADTGRIEFAESTAEINPSFLLRNHEAGRLWTISESEVAGDLVCFQEGAAGELRPRGRVATGADAPCHLAIDWERRLGFVSHYHGGALALLSLRENGEPQASLSLSAPPRIVRGEPREGKSHVHASILLGDGELVVTDTGRDLILNYQIQGERSTRRPWNC